MNRWRATTPRDRALLFVALVAAVLLVVVVVATAGGRPGGGVGRASPDVVPTVAPAASRTPGASPTAGASPSAIPSPPTVVAQPPPSEPPADAPPVAPVAPAATRAPATPLPTPDPNVWRVEGVLVDDATKEPLHDVCVVIGPRGCVRGSVRTDERGVFFFDVPKIPTIHYDLYFVRDGYWTVWVRVKPEGPSVYNLALTRR